LTVKQSSHAKYGPKNTAPHCYCLMATRTLHESFKNEDANTIQELWVNDQLDAHLCYVKHSLLQSSTRFEYLCVHHQEVKLY